MIDSLKINKKNKNSLQNSTISNNNQKDEFNNFKNKRIIVEKKVKHKQKGNYILENTIGEGAFAKVKLGKHIITGEKVAIKILPKQNFSSNSSQNNNYSSNNISKIQKEINILRRLHHKNIIQLYEIIETKNNLYIVMEYCEGKELFDYIVKRKRLTEREACRYFQQIINGVEYLHLCNITHRDLKPENILLDNKKRIRISDFGLSGIVPNYDSLLSTPCGTPLYAPPEMLRGEKYDGVYSDIWSCGIILYTMLVGDLPYADSKEKIIYQNIMTHNYYYPDYLSDDAVDLIEHMLKINPKERYGFKEIKAHPWFNLITPKLRPGVIYNVHKIPIDEKILDRIEKMGYNRKLCIKSVLRNDYDSLMAIYLLTLKQSIREGKESISDLFSDEYIKYINDYKNWIDTSKINSPLFSEYNVVNIPNNNISDENININLGIDNFDIFTDSENNITGLDNIENENLDINNISNEEKKDYLNLLKRKSEDITNNTNNESFKLQGSFNKRLTLKNNITREIEKISEVKNIIENKNFESNNIPSTLNVEEEKQQKNNKIKIKTNKNKKLEKNLKRNDKENKINKYNEFNITRKGMDKNIITQKNNYKKNNDTKLNLDEIIKKRILNLEKAQGSTKLKNESNSFQNKKYIKIIENNKNNYENNLNAEDNDNNINNKIFIENEVSKEKEKEKNIKNNKVDSIYYNNLKIDNDETELDKIFNDNLIDLDSDSKLILTTSGHFNDNNSELKTFLSKDENMNISINSGNNNIDISKKPSNNIILDNISKISNNNRYGKRYSNALKAEKNSKNTIFIKNNKKNKKDNVILLTEPIDAIQKNKLKKEIEEDINKFNNDLTIIDDISKNKFFKCKDDVNNINFDENFGLFNIQDFADKLIRNTIFKNYLIRNNKKLKHEIEDKFYILEKYKSAIGLIEKLKNKIFMDKLSNFNFYTFDQYLNDDDDMIISNNLLKNKNLSLFIKKAKETLFKNNNTINKRSYSKNYTFMYNNYLLNRNNINFKLRSKTLKCQLNNIIMGKDKNYFKRNKYNNYKTIFNTNKISLFKNTDRIKSLLFRNLSPNNLSKKKKFNHSIETKTNKIYNRDNSNIRSKDKISQKRLKFKKNVNLTQNVFNTQKNSIKNFNSFFTHNFNFENNSSSSIESVILEEPNINNGKKINLKKILVNECSSYKKYIPKKKSKLNIIEYSNKNLKTENKEEKNRITFLNKIKKNLKIGFSSDKNITNINNFDNALYENNKIINIIKDKSITNNIGYSITPDHKNTNKFNYKNKLFYNNINNKNNINLKNLRNVYNTKNNIIKKNPIELRKTMTNIKANNKIKEIETEKYELKDLEDNYPININCILIQSLDIIKIKIKKFLKKSKCSFIERENNARILKNGYNINLYFYKIKDFDIDNVYICFKIKGENQKNLELINDLLYYLHNNE